MIKFKKDFIRKSKKGKKTLMDVVIYCIKYYIQNTTLPDKIFNGEYPDAEKFQFVVKVFEDILPRNKRMERYHDDLFNHLLEHNIKDDEVLHWYIKEYLDFYIPREATCKIHNPLYHKFDYPHCAPFDYISDMFFQRCRNSIAFANRTGGKTRNVAILNHLDMAFKADCEVASAGAIKDQATKVYRYFLE